MHRDLTSLAPHERLPEILVLPREKPPGAPQLEETPEKPPSSRVSGGKIEIETRQRRPQFFDIFAFFGGGRAVFDTSSERGDDAPDFDLHGRAAIEAHYTDYLQ